MQTSTIKINVPIAIRKEGDVFVSICPLLNVVSQGCTEEEAKKNLGEALQLFIFTSIEMGTLSQVLKDCGFTEFARHPVNETGMDHLDINLPFHTELSTARCRA